MSDNSALLRTVQQCKDNTPIQTSDLKISIKANSPQEYENLYSVPKQDPLVKLNKNLVVTDIDITIEDRTLLTEYKPTYLLHVTEDGEISLKDMIGSQCKEKSIRERLDDWIEGQSENPYSFAAKVIWWTFLISMLLASTIWKYFIV